jgi:hypothetical protein
MNDWKRLLSAFSEDGQRQDVELPGQESPHRLVGAERDEAGNR